MTKARALPRVTSPRLRGEVDARSASGEGDSPNTEIVESPPHPDPLPASGERECPRPDRHTLSIAACAAISLTACFFSSALAAEIPLDERKSGYEFMGRETRAMQDDDTANPGMLWVLDGEAAWKRKVGTAGKACADCHGDAAESMKGVAARYPAFNAARGRPVNLEQRINICRAEQQQAPSLTPESKELLALAAYVGRQSRGMPVAVTVDERTKPFLEAGRATFFRRQGQLNFACAQCHDDNWKEKLAGAPITQAHPTGYPLYRLEWQTVGSLQRRLRNCITGMRVDNYPLGAPELVDLELYLMWRARDMKLETPAVRP
jgi:L-cysteine S-thiosulfotransferase